jgi:hypothetical protein
MKTLILQKHDGKVKIGQDCPYITPNVTEDCLFQFDGEIIGFYLSDVSKYDKKLGQLLAIANAEFRSDKVPKQEMSRGPQGSKKDKIKRQIAGEKLVTQYSTILGSRAPKPHMRMPYPSITPVHNVKSAKKFIQAMWGACVAGENLIKELTPEIYKRQKQLFQKVDKQWTFGNLFTSSISNYNIAASYHRDTGNLVGSVNIIFTKRYQSKGGCLHVPDFDVTFEQKDNSMLVYPAWKNIHGVTPIQKHHAQGYRNSLIFYPLKAFYEA